LAGDGSNRVLTVKGNDVITTSVGSDVIYSGDGNDSINAGDDNNIINAGNGSDTVGLSNGANKLILERMISLATPNERGNGRECLTLVGGGSFASDRQLASQSSFRMRN
jgi:Ca2+-binding RTX toxin-like protein